MNIDSSNSKKLMTGKSMSAAARLLKISASAAAILGSVLLAAPLLSHNVLATDMGTGATQDQGHHVRIGLGRSVIIHLPREAKDVIVGDNEIVDAVIRNRTTVYLFARKNGQTNIFFLDANGQEVMGLDIEVAQNTLALSQLLQRSIPGNHFTVDVVGNSIVLGGTAMNGADAKTAVDMATQFLVNNGGDASKLVNTMKIAGEDQVMLQVKVVEIQRDILKQWGINFTALVNAGGFAFNMASMNPFANSLISAGNTTASLSAGGVSLTGVLTAMESDGMLHTLAEPNLTTMSGQPASFKAGGQFPFSTGCTGGSGTTPSVCSFEYKDFGVLLDFTPTVLNAGRINLKIHSTVSEISSVASSSVGAPIITNREASTMLELPDGGSMMLAGLIRENTRQTVAGMPGMKNLPILGALFRSRDFVSNQTELVIMVTPHIVRSVAQKQLLAPDENFNVATDRQTILLGRLNKVYGSQGKAPAGTYQGNVGYIVE